MAILRCMQILQVTDPAIIAEALRSKELDKKTVSDALNYFAGRMPCPRCSQPSPLSVEGRQVCTAAQTSPCQAMDRTASSAKLSS